MWEREIEKGLHELQRKLIVKNSQVETVIVIGILSTISGKLAEII